MTPATEAVDKAIAIMSADLTARHSGTDLANAVHLSRWYFHRVFVAATGVTPGRYLTRLRMAAARRLLTTTDRPVTEVGTAVGYATSSTFSDMFLRHHGQRPSVFRVVAQRAGGQLCDDVQGPERRPGLQSSLRTSDSGGRS